jgi:hypothetical protein
MKASWKAPLAILAGAALALWTACRPPLPPPPPPPPPAAAASGAVPRGPETALAATTAAPRPLPSEALAPLLRRGALHGAPIELPSGKEPPRWLVLLGGEEAAKSAWILQPGGSPAIIPADFPQAVRVTGQRTQGSTVYLEVTSVAAGDLPGGLRAIVPIDGPSGEIVAREWATLLGVEGLSGLDAYLAQARSSADYRLPSGEDSTQASLAALLPAGGTEVFTTWPSRGGRRTGRLVPADLASSPSLGPALALLGASSMQCARSLCEGRDGDGFLIGHALLDMEGDRLVLRRLLLAPPPPARTATPRRVAARAEGAGLGAALRPLVAGVKGVLAEAPFSAAGGAVGVAEVIAEDSGDSDRHLTVAVSEGPLTRAYDVSFAFASPAPIEVGFADIDGDGYTDVVTRTPGKKERTPMVFLVPPASRPIDLLRPDLASIWPLREARSLDDAIGRALAIPARGLTSAEACPLLLAPLPAGVRLFDYTEPNPYDTGRTMRELTPARHRELQGSEPLCASPLLCSPTRPVCRDHGENNPALSYYWFRWSRGAPRLAAVADYGGS